MKKLKQSLKNCYGIRRLEATLDFSKGRNIAIYASNGTMKSSLARTFKDARDDTDPRDRIYGVPGRYEILCDGRSIARDSILVFDPSDEKDEAQTSAGILVSDKLRTEYNAIISGISGDLAPLVRRLNKLSGVAKSSIPSTILADHGMAGQPDDRIYGLLLERAKADDPEKSKELAALNYSRVFNADTEKVLGDPRFQGMVAQYIERYDRLVSQSRFLKGRFDQHAMGALENSLEKSGILDAGHEIRLNPKPGRAGGAETIKDIKRYAKVSEEEENTLTKELDPDWKVMEKMLARTIRLNDFRLLLAENRWLVPRLGDISALKRALWTTYLALERETAADICEKYERSRERMGEIVKEAESERPRWKDIVEEFTRRFDVPFSVQITNQAEALLGIRVPALEFTYKDADGGRVVERGLLKSTLSDGERRALYTLNMLFEVQKQADGGRETVAVIDDLADSFDYKNKYAIVHYLKEVLDRPNFHMIILTHNFDFLRTVKSRGIVGGRQVYFVDKKIAKTTLLPTKIHDNPLDALVGNLEKPASLIASIPFARNIVEYTRGSDDDDGYYRELTRLLHWRERTGETTVKALLQILCRVFPKAAISPVPEDGEGGTVFGAIVGKADECSLSHRDKTLEEKIVLSVATRLLAERFLVGRLLGGIAPPVDARTSIHDWIAEYRRALEKGAEADGRPLSGRERRELEVLDDVALMTPEAIHVNSFMYEPILDMPGSSLAELYRAVHDLGGEAGGA